MAIGQLVSSYNAFAFELHGWVRDKQANTVFSPHSVASALSLVYAGARGDTEAELARALHLTLAQEQLHAAVHQLSLQFAGADSTGRRRSLLQHQLEIATSLWARLGSHISPEYVQTLVTYYGIEPGFLDFAGDPEGSETAINDWVSRETGGKIESLIPSGVISPVTRLIIANAVFFKAAWSTPFDPSMTSTYPFTLPNGDQVPVPMMFQIARLGYSEVGELLAIELPYTGEQTSMVILLPRDPAVSLDDISADLEQTETLLCGLVRRTVALTLPSFGFDSAFRLSPALSALGMAAAFSPKADLTGISPQGGIYLSEVLHKAFVSVDEAGTEAGAASAVVLSDAAAPSSSLYIRVDRPFLFLIRHIPTGSILFLGEVVDPRK